MTLKIGNLGEGGQGISEGHKGAGVSMKELFDAVRDELDAMKSAGTVTQANAATQGGGYVQADVQSIADLANDLKVKMNALVASGLATFEK